MAKSSNTVGFANVMAIVGLMLFGALTYFGQMFLSGGEIGLSLLWAIGFTAIGIFLLVFMISAKGKDNNFSLWRTIEFSTLGLYIVFAALTFRGPVYFIAVMADKNSIQTAGKGDLKMMESLFENYEEMESDAINNTHTGLISTVGNPNLSDEVRSFMNGKAIYPTEESVANFCDAQRDLLLGANYKHTKADYKARLDEWRAYIEGWNIFRLPFVGPQMEEASEALAEELTALSAKGALPVVKRYGQACVIAEQTQKYTFDAPSMQLASRLKQTGIGNPLAWVGLVIIHALVLFNYFMARRSEKTHINQTIGNGSSQVL